MKRDEIIARVSGGETVFREGGFEVSYCIGRKRGEAVQIRADQFGYLLDAGLISEAGRERGQPWYQGRWKRAAKRRKAAKQTCQTRTRVGGGAKVPKSALPPRKRPHFRAEAGR